MPKEFLHPNIRVLLEIMSLEALCTTSPSHRGKLALSRITGLTDRSDHNLSQLAVEPAFGHLRWTAAAERLDVDESDTLSHDAVACW